MQRLQVALVGGDARQNLTFPEQAQVRRFASDRFGGNGSVRRVLESIASGRVDIVVLLVRWVGHSSSESIRRACRRSGVRLIVVPGGEASARAIVCKLVGD